MVFNPFSLVGLADAGWTVKLAKSKIDAMAVFKIIELLIVLLISYYAAPSTTCGRAASESFRI